MPSIKLDNDITAENMREKIINEVKMLVKYELISPENVENIRKICSAEKLSPELIQKIQTSLVDENNFASKNYVDAIIGAQNSHITNYMKSTFNLMNEDTSEKMDKFIINFKEIFNDACEKISSDIIHNVDEKLNTMKHKIDMKMLDLNREFIASEKNILGQHMNYQEYIDTQIRNFFVKPSVISTAPILYHTIQFNGYNNNACTIHVGTLGKILVIPKGSGKDMHISNNEVEYDVNTGMYIIKTKGIYIIDANFIYSSNTDASGTIVKILMNDESIAESVVPLGVVLSPGVICNGPVAINVMREIVENTTIAFVHTHTSRTIKTIICSGSFKIYRI